MSSPPAAYEPTAPGETTPHWSYLEVCRIAENKRTHEPRTNEQRVKQTHRTLFTRQSTQGQSESKKKLMCATGVWGGGGGIAPGEWFSLRTALKRRPQLLSQSYGLAMQCKCSYTMKTALKSHFFWKYIFLRLLLHRITVAVCLTFDNSIFKLKTSWDNFSSISWERENGGHRQKSHIFYCSVSKKERKKEIQKDYILTLASFCCSSRDFSASCSSSRCCWIFCSYWKVTKITEKFSSFPA